jgi:hypothetical protein
LDVPPSQGPYFRGTSSGFPGSDTLRRIEITPVSTDPVVATIFATESSSYGPGVVQVALAEDLAGLDIGPGNVLAALEREVAIGVAPLEFAARASTTITVAEARTILQDMGISVPRVIVGPAGVDAALRSIPRLTPEQIEHFMQTIRR